MGPNAFYYCCCIKIHIEALAYLTLIEIFSSLSLNLVKLQKKKQTKLHRIHVSLD